MRAAFFIEILLLDLKPLSGNNGCVQSDQGILLEMR